eukprot:9501788-Pyramimonas_sp.AAC.2
MGNAFGAFGGIRGSIWRGFEGVASRPPRYCYLAVSHGLGGSILRFLTVSHGTKGSWEIPERVDFSRFR